MQIIFFTTGCRLNQIESESASHYFVEKDFSVSLVPLTAKSLVDSETVLAVVNTCAVTQKAEQKDRRMIRLLLEKCPNACVVVTGCYAQLSKEQILKMSPRIAVLKGLLKSRIVKVAEILKQNLQDKKDFNAEDFALFLNEKVFSANENTQKVSEDAFKLSTDSFLAHSRPSLKIQDGCNSSCSYCTIHTARGGAVSLSVEEVISRVKNLENLGFVEVVFTTVNIGQYKSEYQGETFNFSKLLHLCLKETKNINFRISSLYPEVVDEYFCQVISHNRVRPHFHLSVQSGSDKILKLMNRKYSREDVIRACKMLNQYSRTPFLACDIITGFPGETEEDFEQTLDLCKKCNFSWVHIFPYSERPGTPACSMPGKVPQSVRDERAKRLLIWAKNNKAEYIKSFEEKTVRAVLETVKNKTYIILPDGKKQYSAVTENFLHCKIITEKDFENLKSGMSINVKILSPLDTEEADCLAEFC